MATDPSTWSDRMKLRVEMQRFIAKTAYGFVEIEMSGLNQKFQDLVATGTMMQDDLKNYAFEMYSRIAMRTPVRTGRARAAWHIVPPNTPSDAYTYEVPPSRYGPGGTFDGSLAGASTGPWDAIIGNNVEYILALEAGWSRQAPNGMVAITLAEMKDALALTIQARLQQAGRA